MTIKGLDEFITVDELATTMRVPRATVYYWQATRKGPPAIRIGKRLLFRKSDVQAWLDRLEAAS